MKKTMFKRMIVLMLVLAQLVCLVPVLSVSTTAASAPIRPFGFSNANYQESEIEMGGISYPEGVIFTMGYTGISNGNTSIATYNLKSQYSSFSFVAGYVKGAERNAKLSILADGATVLDGVELKYESIARSFNIAVSGVEQLIIKFESGGYDKTKYAIASVNATAVGNTESVPLVSDEFYDIPRYKYLNAWAIEDNFSMGGYDYTNGYMFQMGYTGSSDGKFSKVCFNFNNQYRQLEFDIAKFMHRHDEPYTRSALLTIEADGSVISGYDKLELKWNDITRHVTVNLNGVSELIITLESDGYDKVRWAMGDIQLVSDGKAHGVLLASENVTLTSSAPTFDLNPRVYPSDASNKNCSAEYTPTIVIMMDDDIIYGRSAGNATVTYTTEQGGHQKVCKVTSKLPAAKYVPSEDGWGFHNYGIDWSEFTNNFDYYASTYERISGRFLSYAADDALDIPFNPSEFSPLAVMSNFTNGVDAAWYIGMSSAMTGFSSLFGGEGAGQCHGMSVSSALTYTGDLPFSTWDISSTYKQPFDIKSISNKTGYSKSLELYLKQLIFGCHITQVGTQDLVSSWATKNKYDKLIEAVKSFRSSGKNPVAITLDKSGASHTMLAYDVLEIKEFLLLYVYDPNINSHEDPDNVYLLFLKDENGNLINWNFKYKDTVEYCKDDSDITFSTGLSTYAVRIKAKKEVDTAKNIIFTNAKNFFVKKDGNTLLNYNNGRFTGDTEQSIAVPFTPSGALSGADGNGGTLVVLTEDTGVTIELADGTSKTTTAYYNEDSATIVESDGSSKITLTPGATVDTVKKKPSKKGEVSVRYNNEDGSVIAKGNTDTTVTVTKDEEKNEAAFAGFTNITPSAIDTEGNKSEGKNTSTSAGGSYSVDDKGNVVPSLVLPFKDVKDGAWYYDAIAYCYKNKIFSGTSDVTFEPDTQMTRAMFVRTLANIDGVDLSKYTKNNFSDVKEGSWYVAAVNWAADKDIVSGIGEGLFGPNQSLTREQMAAILYRYAQYKRKNMNCAEDKFNSFADKTSVSGWAKNAMIWMTDREYISGTSDGTAVYLTPKGTSTRSQAARVLMVFIQS